MYAHVLFSGKDQRVEIHSFSSATRQCACHGRRPFFFYSAGLVDGCGSRQRRCRRRPHCRQRYHRDHPPPASPTMMTPNPHGWNNGDRGPGGGPLRRIEITRGRWTCMPRMVSSLASKAEPPRASFLSYQVLGVSKLLEMARRGGRSRASITPRPRGTARSAPGHIIRVVHVSVELRPNCGGSLPVGEEVVRREDIPFLGLPSASTGRGLLPPSASGRVQCFPPCCRICHISIEHT